MAEAARPATAVDRLGELLPADGIRQVVAVLEEYQRRAAAGRRIPKLIDVQLLLDRVGRVDGVMVPRLFGR